MLLEKVKDDNSFLPVSSQVMTHKIISPDTLSIMHTYLWSRHIIDGYLLQALITVTFFDFDFNVLLCIIMTASG